MKADGAFDRVVKGHAVRDTRFAMEFPATKTYRWTAGIGDVGSMKRRQADLTMSCELELLHGRPYDLPGCAASADP